MNTYQSQLQAFLQASTLTPGAYTPSLNIKTVDHVAVCMCVNTELARIIDPKAPEMCDGNILPHLAKQSSTTMHVH